MDPALLGRRPAFAEADPSVRSIDELTHGNDCALGYRASGTAQSLDGIAATNLVHPFSLDDRTELLRAQGDAKLAAMP